jgi:phenylacetate-CoA ligase
LNDVLRRKRVAVYDKGWYKSSPVFVQEAAITGWGLATRLMRRGKVFRRELDELEKSQWFSPDEFEALQNERLAALVRHCYEKVPYYRRVMKELGLTPADVTTVPDLSKLPYLTKEIVRTEADALLPEDLGRFGVYRSKTSGTTGTPLKLVRDLASINTEYAFIWRAWRSFGFDLGDSRAIYRGDFIVPPEQTEPPYWRHNRAEQQLFCSMLHLSPATAAHYFAAMRRFEPKALEAFPTGADYLARLAREQGERLDVDYVLTSSEPIPPDMRKRIEDTFSCEVVDYYGQAERVSFAMECPEHTGLHVAPEYGVTELVEPDGDAPEGTREIVGTPFINYSMPLLRYRTGDLTVPMETECPCGRKMPLIAPIETRVGANIILQDGRCVSYLALTRVFGPLANIRRSQLIQDRVDHIRVKVVPGSGFSGDDADSIRTGIRQILSADVSIDIELLEDIPIEKSGKLRWFISELSDDGGGAP